MDEFDISYEMDLSQPGDELLEYARQNLNEDPSTRNTVLEDLKAVIKKKGEYKCSRMDDPFLLRFLRAKEFDVKEAHRCLVNYQEYKGKYPKYYREVKFERMRAIGDHNVVGTQPFVDGCGRRIAFCRMGNWEPDKISVRELFQCSILVAELAILEQRSQILGGVGIFDLEGISMTQVKHLTPKIAARIMQGAMHSYPARIHAIHVVNDTPVFKTGYSIAKPFINKEMKKRIFFHGTDMTSLHKHIDPKYLPIRYGGIHPDYGYGKWITNLLNNQVALNELKTLGYEGIEEEVRTLKEF